MVIIDTSECDVCKSKIRQYSVSSSRDFRLLAPRVSELCNFKTDRKNELVISFYKICHLKKNSIDLKTCCLLWHCLLVLFFKYLKNAFEIKFFLKHRNRLSCLLLISVFAPFFFIRHEFFPINVHIYTVIFHSMFVFFSLFFFPIPIDIPISIAYPFFFIRY